MLTYPVGLLSPGAEDKILVTMDMSTPSTAGITLTFASGSLDIDWKEGGGKEAFTTGVEKTHAYVTPGTYIAEITGDFANITQFVADNSKITNISNFKTGLLTNLRLHQNLFTSIDLSDVPVSGTVFIYDCPNITSVTFASSGNSLVTSFVMRQNPNLASLDLSNVPVSATFDVRDSGISGITFASSGNSKVTIFRAYNCSSLTSLNLANVPVGGSFEVYNSGISGITFSSTGNTIVSTFSVYSCSSLTSLDLSNVPISTNFRAFSNPLMTSLIFSTTGNSTVTLFSASDCDLSSLDLSNVPISTAFAVRDNSNLSSLTLAAAGNGALTIFAVRGCSLPNIDLTVFSTSDGVSIEQEDNAMTSTEVDNQLINLDSTGWINGTLDIAGTNAARTAASDTAYNNLIANGWAITVN
jgi:hypothetical protein